MAGSLDRVFTTEVEVIERLKKQQSPSPELTRRIQILTAPAEVAGTLNPPAGDKTVRSFSSDGGSG
jgi:hypothetical protein